MDHLLIWGFGRGWKADRPLGDYPLELRREGNVLKAREKEDLCYVEMQSFTKQLPAVIWKLSNGLMDLR